MFRKGGIRIFFFGTTATVLRDFTFGGTFALLRHEIRNYLKESYDIKKFSFLIDLIAGSIATLMSSPMNYVRNINYAIPPDKPNMCAYTILNNLYNENKTLITTKQRIFHIQEKLKIGWGTARVGCGMAFGSIAYSFLVEKL